MVITEGLEDPLDDLAMVQQQLDQLSVIVRCEYDQTCNFLIQTFDRVSFTLWNRGEFSELLNQRLSISDG